MSAFDDRHVGRSDLYLPLHSRNLKTNIERRDFAHGDHHVARFALKPGIVSDHVVGARWQATDAVPAVLVGGNASLDAFVGRGCRYRGLGDDGATRIVDHSRQLA